VNAEESRAVGGSGLQPWTTPLHGSLHLTQSSWLVADWRCQIAVTPILSVVDTQLLFLPERVADTLTDLELSSCLLRPTAQDEPLKDLRSPRRRFGYFLVTRADRPPPKVVRNPLRSDLTLPLCRGSYELNVRLGSFTGSISTEEQTVEETHV